MIYNPFNDSKFRLGLLDAAVFLALYFGGKYAPASVFEDLKTVFATIQPLLVIWIANLFVADQTALRMGNQVKHFLFAAPPVPNVKGPQPK